MKKLLSVLGSLAISAMTVATVIACSTLSYDTEEPENLQQLLDEISIKINNDMQYWFKQNGEVFFANQKDLDFLRTKYNNAEGEFPVYILSTDLPETFNKFMQAAKNKFYDLGKELLYSAKFGHLFTGLEPSQIIDVLEWKELKLNDFDIVKKVNEHSSQEGYSEMALKADSIADSFQISGKFKVIFNFVIGDQKNTHVTPSNFFNTYLTNDVITFHEVSNWIKKDFPNLEYILKEHVLTYKGHDKVDDFDKVEELYQENGDILNVLSTNPKFDKSKLKVETLKYISSSKGIGTATTYLDRIGVKGDTPLSDERENPVPNIGDGSIVPYLAGFNSMLNEKATGIDNPVSFIDDLGKKESFVNTVLYGSSAKINDSDKRDPIFWDEMPGILAFDKEYKQSFIGKNLEKEDSEGIRYNTNLKENYLTPIKNFVEDVQTYKFSGNIPKEEIIVQDEVVILAGEPNEGVLTETNVSDVGHINLVQWFYDGLPLDLVENVPFIATPTNNKPIEKLYRDILTYAYDLFIEEWNGGSEDRATSLLNNMWADSNNTWNNNPNTFTLSSGAGERVRYDGLNFFILNNDDYDKYNRFGNAGPPIIDAVDYVVKQQHNSIKDSHTLKPELLVSQNRNMEAHNPSIESNVVYLKDPEIKYTGLYALESKINSKTPNWRNYLSNIANNITLNINGIDFALNNYNLWQNNSESTLEIARWNLGMSALGGIKASATVTPKYTGNIW